MSPEQASFRTRVVEQSFRYWWSKRKPGRLPRRADLRLEEMSPLLPHVFLVDVSYAPLSFRFRRIGTEICRLAGHDVTGIQVNRQEYGADWKSLFEVYWRVVDTASAEVCVRRAPWKDREFLLYERLIAPLSSDGRTVDMLFGALQHLAHDPVQSRGRDVL